MSRLASFRGPSTPTSSPVTKQPASSPSGSPARGPVESPYHRKLRTALLDIRACTRTWDDLVLHDGLRAARVLIDARTELHNNLATASAKSQPRNRVVGPQLELMDEKISQLDVVNVKLNKQFQKMASIIDNLEATVSEAHKTKGWQWTASQPLWTTWSLEKFVTSITGILAPYRRSLDMHTEIVNTLRSHTVSFEVSREAIDRWSTQPYLVDESWEAEWEDLCEAEVDRWMP